MFGSTPAAPTTGSTLGRSASFSFSQPPAHKPFSGSSGGFSLGGGAAAATSTAASSTGAAAPAAGGFSFGAKPATTTAAPAAGGGLFGSSTTTQPQQQQQQPQSGFGGGLFGASNNTAASTSTGGGLFGKPAAAPAAGGFSFGSSSNNAASSSAGGLFGSSTQPAQQQQQQQPSTSLFSFGSSQPQQQQQQQQNNTFQPFQSQPQFNQAGTAAASPFARHGYFQKERFNELPDDARKLVEELETHISAQTQLRDELKTKNFGDEIRKCAAEWHELDAALKSLSATLDTDENQTRDVGRLLERDRTTTSTLYAIVVNAKEPRAPGASDGTSFVEWLERFFGQLAVEHRDRIARYAATVETIQHHLASLSSRDTYTPHAISDAIHAQHESFMTLAAQVAALHAEVEALKKDYARWYKQVHKSVRDPFGSMNALAGSVPPAS
ncbi:related to NUP49-nuclear pore protein [Sporisorium reilianum f. sp. reilianum]|uniref:Related to NUP49-nuclear pore protein n=1 Tax=Sporisorium reilianum f. sp. reilianum TaxID=72559 RepID=A0A2N8U9U8_9BASI|nr:related to NUP49-nuclear pore protein [Sporisorium reilianum f. sp. reilianum]